MKTYPDVKERPILMSGVNVRAILEDRKNQTRRVVKPQPRFVQMLRDGRVETSPDGGFDQSVNYIECPYGQPGDRLWVKEAWRTRAAWNHLPPSELPIDFDSFLHDHREQHVHYVESPEGGTALHGRYRHGRFMPRWASRLTLEITGIRVERLQEISEADARAEGIFKFSGLGFYGYDKAGTPGPHCCDTARDTYRALWESINGEGSWDANPFVWVIEFRRI